MGFPMAGRLAAFGFALKVYDLDRRVKEQFIAEHKAAESENPAEMARRSDLVITMLPDSEAVQAIVLGLGKEDSIASSMAPGSILLVGCRFGVDPKVMNDILNASTGRKNSTENKIEKYVFFRSFFSGFSLDLRIKDLDTAKTWPEI